MKVGIQGIRGAFHEVAAGVYFGDKLAEVVPHLTFEQLVDAVENESDDYGIIAIENTISGTIHANLNLIRNRDVEICGEIFLRISQNLASLPGSHINDINEVRSHYMAINQCRVFFRQYPHIRLVESEDTALSMKEIADTRQPGLGAIGSLLASQIYGLEVLASDIETNKKNYTRFLIITKNNHHTSKVLNKASINIVLQNTKGSLSQILSIIAFYGIDLTKIESVPIIGEPWNYMFYIDLKFTELQKYFDMISAIRPLIKQIKVLGIYEDGEISYNLIHNQ